MTGTISLSLSDLGMGDCSSIGLHIYFTATGRKNRPLKSVKDAAPYIPAYSLMLEIRGATAKATHHYHKASNKSLGCIIYQLLKLDLDFNRSLFEFLCIT